MTVSSGSPTDHAGVVKYTVTGLTDGTPVDIQLADPANVTTDANGQTTFKDNGSGAADFGSPAGDITVVNGIPDGNGDQKNDGVMPVNGQVTFSVDSTTPGSAQPVVYAQPSSGNALALDDNGAPKQDFGVGGAVTWTAAPAGSGTYDGTTGNPSNLTVTSVNPANNTFQATYNDAAGNPQAGTFSYGAPGSTYTYVNGLPMSESQFAADLGKDDVLSAKYNANGPSAWTYSTDVPAAPTNVAASYDASANSGAGDVTITWKDVPNSDVTGYTVTRYTVKNGKVDTGSAQDVAGAWNSDGSATKATDTPAGGTYEYTVTADSTNGGSGPESDYSGSVTVPTAASAQVTGPLSTKTSAAVANAGALAKGDTIDVFFNTPVSIAPSWSLEVADSAGNTVLLNSTNSTASTAAGGTEAIIQVNKDNPVVLSGSNLTAGATGSAWEIVSQGGFNGTGSGTPAWDLQASGAKGGSVNEGGSAVGVTREINTDGSQAKDNAALVSAPTVSINSNGTWNYTCNTATDSINVYDASGAFLGSQACANNTANAKQSAPAGVTFTSGNTYQFTESSAPAPVYNGQESATAVVLAP